MLSTVLAFVVAMGLLVAFHEWGHYRMAVACGVKVLRFSVGFGRVIWRYRPKNPKPGQEDCEYVLSAIPLGGYVRMLNGQEGDVPAHERHRAFDQQPLRNRALIVAAGPLANLLLAVLLYSVVNWWGSDEARPILAPPAAGTLAERAGVQAGDEVIEAVLGEGEGLLVRSFDELRWLITKGAVNGESLKLQVQRAGALTTISLPLHTLQTKDPDAALFERIGILAPQTKPRIGEVQAGGAAAVAGLRSGDLVLRVDDVPVTDGTQLRTLIRASDQGAKQMWQVERDGLLQTLSLTPGIVFDGEKRIGRIGAFVGEPPASTRVRYGLFEGAARGIAKTWDMSGLTLRMMWRMVTGQASLKNISGPLTIADYAGKSAHLGVAAFVTFLAVLSVSLGVLNLLPIPVLDGGHLMYYLWEAVSGAPPSEIWLERLQRGGLAALFLMMSLALFNDLSRYVLPWFSQ